MKNNYSFHAFERWRLIIKSITEKMSSIKITVVFIALFLIVSGTTAQEHLPFMPGMTKKSPDPYTPWLAPAAGFVPSNEAFRFSIVSGNLLLNRVGGYATIEKGFDSDYFTNIYGISVTLSRHFYLWGGVDLFTSHGIINSIGGSRKEIGIGVMPWKGMIVNTGWSKSVGFTFSLGWKLPIFRPRT